MLLIEKFHYATSFYRDFLLQRSEITPQSFRFRRHSSGYFVGRFEANLKINCFVAVPTLHRLIAHIDRHHNAIDMSGEHVSELGNKFVMHFCVNSRNLLSGKLPNGARNINFQSRANGRDKSIEIPHIGDKAVAFEELTCEK